MALKIEFILKRTHCNEAKIILIKAAASRIKLQLCLLGREIDEYLEAQLQQQKKRKKLINP